LSFKVKAQKKDELDRLMESTIKNAKRFVIKYGYYQCLDIYSRIVCKKALNQLTNSNQAKLAKKASPSFRRQVDNKDDSTQLGDEFEFENGETELGLLYQVCVEFPHLCGPPIDRTPAEVNKQQSKNSNIKTSG
jgi:hypothetical protein